MAESREHSAMGISNQPKRLGARSASTLLLLAAIAASAGVFAQDRSDRATRPAAVPLLSLTAPRGDVAASGQDATAARPAKDAATDGERRRRFLGAVIFQGMAGHPFGLFR